MSTTSGKARFSEVMWFKHGEQEELAVQAADTEEATPVAVSTLPIEDRYHDDSSLSRDEVARLSLRTGSTSQVPSIQQADSMRRMHISDRELLAPARGAPLWLFALAILAAAAFVVVRVVL